MGLECEELECESPRSAVAQCAAAPVRRRRVRRGPRERQGAVRLLAPRWLPTAARPSLPRRTPACASATAPSATRPTRATGRTGARPTAASASSHSGWSLCDPADFRGAPRSRGAMDPIRIWRTATGSYRPGGSQYRLSHCDVLLYPPCRNRRLQEQKSSFPDSNRPPSAPKSDALPTEPRLLMLTEPRFSFRSGSATTVPTPGGDDSHPRLRGRSGVFA